LKVGRRWLGGLVVGALVVVLALAFGMWREPDGQPGDRSPVEKYVLVPVDSGDVDVERAWCDANPQDCTDGELDR